jgi:DNA-directed RNA polymerase sigma subunit (sigma70/sigma32)
METGKVARRPVTDRQRHVLDGRAQGRSYAALALDLGVTRERVRQIEALARRREARFRNQDGPQ